MSEVGFVRQYEVDILLQLSGAPRRARRRGNKDDHLRGLGEGATQHAMSGRGARNVLVPHGARACSTHC